MAERSRRPKPLASKPGYSRDRNRMLSSGGKIKTKGGKSK